MSPYAFKILRLAGAALFSISITSLMGTYTTLKGVSHSVLVFGLTAAALVGLLAYVLFYFSQISQTNNLVGIYVSARNLRNADERLANALRVQRYNKYYRRRREDNGIRESLRTTGGVVILGQPFSGKTRAALQGLLETDPAAYILSFTGVDGMTQDKISEIIKEIYLPCFFVFFAKPVVVVLIDDAHRFVHFPFQQLWARLREQCSRISIIVTCSTGASEKGLAGGELQQLARSLRRVELGPLDPQARIDIYSHVWNKMPGPLGVDLSLPGLIIWGPQGMRDTYRSLPPRNRRIISALALARACGEEPCERAFLNEILKNVLAQDVTGIELSISAMADDHVLVVDENDKIFFQNDEFVVADSQAHYPMILDLKKDLRKLESVLTFSGDADRLLQLGVHYWRRFYDRESARRAIEVSLQRKPSPLAHASLARLYLWFGEWERARAAIDTALALTTEENEKAAILSSFADELLFNSSDGEKALGWYTLAAHHAQNDVTVARVSFRRGDCLVRLKRFSEAESIYRDYLAKAPEADKSQVTARLTLTILAGGRVPEARSLLRQTWDSKPPQEWVALAIHVLENAEGFFSDMLTYLQSASDAVVEEYRDCALRLEEHDGTGNPLLVFANECLISGFLTAAVPPYQYLINNAAKFRIEEVDLVNCWLNLGAALRDCQQFTEARAAFRNAHRLVRQNAASRSSLTYVFAGLADCDLFEKQSASDAAPQYREALNLAQEYGDENAISWAEMGLGDIAILNGEFAKAQEIYATPRLVPNTVSGISRIDLGLARTCLEHDALEDAEFYIADGIASTSRLDYRFRQAQFQELGKQLTRKRQMKSAKAAEADVGTDSIRLTMAPASTMEFYSCFISYSTRDREFAQRLYADLRSEGVRCWFAPEDLKIGDKLRPALDEGIHLHDKLLVLLSENSVRSVWVEKEVETAFDEERRQNRTVLFPIRLDDAVMETGQAWAADIRRSRHMCDFRDWKNQDSYRKALDRLLRDLKAEAKADSGMQG